MIDSYLLSKYVSLCNFEGLKPRGKNYNFRCPICKDSKKNKRKMRGFILVKSDMVTYVCHNCGTSISFVNYLRVYQRNVYEEYRKDTFKALGKKKPVFDMTDFGKKLVVPHIKVLSRLERVKDNEQALKYCVDRKFPDSLIKDLRYSDNFMKFLDEEKIKEIDFVPEEDPRIVIPFYNEDKELTYIQGRAIGESNKNFRYLTGIIKDDEPKIWGLDRVNKQERVYITEGVFDACFVDNCIAIGSSNTDWEYLVNKFGAKNLVMVFDNDIRTNDQLKKIAMKIIKKGVFVYFWSKDTKEKDINEMVVNGKDVKEINTMIQKECYSGLMAETRLKMLRREI